MYDDHPYLCSVGNTEGQASFTSRKSTSLFFFLQLSTNFIAISLYFRNVPMDISSLSVPKISHMVIDLERAIHEARQDTLESRHAQARLGKVGYYSF